MLEIPEALTLSRQLNCAVSGKRISHVTADHTPHKFAWYCGDPAGYHGLLVSKTMGDSVSYGGMVEIRADDALIVLGEGVSLRYHAKGERHPKKHQLLIQFEDDSAMSASIRMYGWLLCSLQSDFDNPYREIAMQKPSPLSDRFNWHYFSSLAGSPEAQQLSAKAFLATEQRIPGLGNGVLQDILYHAGIHPKRKMRTLIASDEEHLFYSVKATLNEMAGLGGRDTEKDLFGQAGRYQTRVSRNTWRKPCSVCGSTIQKGTYLGGSVYYCEGCQPL